MNYLQVRNALIKTIDAAYPMYPVYGESIKQNLKPPCFFVKLLEPSHERELGERFRREFPFVIHFFAVDRDNESMLEVAETLTDKLAWIQTDDGKLLGMRMRFDVIDEVLFFYVTYQAIVRKVQTPVDKMQEIDSEVVTLEI